MLVLCHKVCHVAKKAEIVMSICKTICHKGDTLLAQHFSNIIMCYLLMFSLGKNMKSSYEIWQFLINTINIINVYLVSSLLSQEIIFNKRTEFPTVRLLRK